MSILNHPSLVLNKNYVAIHVSRIKKVMLKFASGLVEAIDHEDYMRYSWADWLALPVTGSHKAIRTTRGEVRAPLVVVAVGYGKVPNFGVKLTKRNIFVRDNGLCQYSGKKLTLKSATLDHVIPRSQGGRSSWDNLVLCDRDVNSKKGDKTPIEANLKIRSTPRQPKWSPAYRSGLLDDTPKEWAPFLSSI